MIKEYSYFIPAKPENTNNVAEYMAFIRALKHIQENKFMGKAILIQGDSQLCVKQLCGEWGIKEGQYVKYAKMAKELLSEIKKNNTIHVKWIPREQNKVADELSKRELIKHNISITERKK